MKKIHFIFFLFAFLLNVTTIKAQKRAQPRPQKNTVAVDKPCHDYACTIQKVKQEITAKHYENAFRQIKSANGYSNNQDTKEIDALYRLLFDAILKDTEMAIAAKKTADTKTKEANVALEQVKSEQLKTQAALAVAKNEKEKADSTLTIVKAEQAKNKKIIDASYFYADRYGMAVKKQDG
ncbi:MAG: hypothetical protein RI894_1208, partial [Bacteroidota bacterium]